MNRQQKEVQQQFLDNEKAVLKQLEKNYQDALDEINLKIEALLARQDADMQHVIYRIEYQKALKTQVQTALEQLHNKEFETLSGFLAGAYEDGFVGTMYDLQGQGVPLVFPIDQEQVIAAVQHETQLTSSLYTELGHDIKDLSKKISAEISRGISTGAMYGEMARNIASYANIPKNRAMTIARTEAHRIQCAATANAQWKAKEKGADVVKQWDASLDGRTRDTHRLLDGQIRELDEPFEVAGKKAMYPGAFGDPAEDCNCRCALLQRARWALDRNITKWANGEGLVEIKAKDYQSFKNEYFKKVDEAKRVRQNVPKIKPEVVELQKYNVDGTTYIVDGKHVILDSTAHEKEVAKLLSAKLGKRVNIVPRVVSPQGVSTPDYLIGGKRYDLKEPEGSGKNVLYNMVHKKKSQANNFVFDISKCPLDYNAIKKQVGELYSSKYTSFVEEIIIIKDGRMLDKFRRAK